jgi:putative spermidine/putrescine transport system permease protein
MAAIGEPGFTLAHFREVLSAPGFLASVGLTLSVSLLSTLGTVVIAIATALALRSMRRFRRLSTFLYQLPLTLPHMVIAAATIMLLSQSGLVSRILAAVGILDGPAGFPALVYDRGGVGIILVYVWKQVPFVGLFALTVLQGVGEDYEAVARTLGARPWQAIRHVLLPLLVPGLLPSSIIIFAFVFGAFEVPLLLGARYPSMLSVLAYRLYTDVDLTMRPQAMALSIVIALVTFLLVAAYRWLARAREAA